MTKQKLKRQRLLSSGSSASESFIIIFDASIGEASVV